MGQPRRHPDRDRPVTRPFVLLQRMLPQHALSRVLGRVAASERRWLAQSCIRAFARGYGIDLADAERTRPEDYKSFNDFFTRRLKPEARGLDPDPERLVCPADGVVSQAGRLTEGQLVQAKGQRYALDDLIGRSGARYLGGDFVTIYLAPRDYHRVHLPLGGRLQQTTALPGELFSVNATTAQTVPGLFCRNERLVCEFETRAGGMLVILVGALIVASIETVWGGPLSPYRTRQDDHWDLAFERGAEIGRFLLGSPVIVVTEPGRLALARDLTEGRAVRMGTAIGAVTR
jgi:phosphatidylserine decarboxylase